MKQSCQRLWLVPEDGADTSGEGQATFKVIISSLILNNSFLFKVFFMSFTTCTLGLTLRCTLLSYGKIPQFFYCHGAHPLMWMECTSECQPRCINSIFPFLLTLIVCLIFIFYFKVRSSYFFEMEATCTYLAPCVIWCAASDVTSDN